MSYCRVHDGLYYTYEDGCPKCRDDAEQAASDRSDIISGLARSREDLDTAAWYIANPGDYSCPSCKFLTLKKVLPVVLVVRQTRDRSIGLRSKEKHRTKGCEQWPSKRPPQKNGNAEGESVNLVIFLSTHSILDGSVQF